MHKALWLLLVLASLSACVPLVAAGVGAGATYWATETESGQRAVHHLE